MKTSFLSKFYEQISIDLSVYYSADFTITSRKSVHMFKLV